MIFFLVAEQLALCFTNYGANIQFNNFFTSAMFHDFFFFNLSFLYVKKPRYDHKDPGGNQTLSSSSNFAEDPVSGKGYGYNCNQREMLLL